MPHDFPLADLGLLMLVASVVAIVSRRLRLPYSVGLVAAGAALAFLPLPLHLPLTQDLIFQIMLPPLIFEAAIQIPWIPFRRDLPLTLTLAFAGVAVAAAVTAAGMYFVLGWSWIGGAMFGVLISATDPVAVIAAFKEMRVEHRLGLLVEGESLLNDGAAVVGFTVLATILAGGGAAPLQIGLLLLRAVAGGVLIGGAVAAAVLLLAGRTDDHLVEITLTVVIAYGSFLIAEHVHASGVLATVTAGIIVGNSPGRWRAISTTGRQHIQAFWAYVAFLANSAIFILIGLNAARQPLIPFAAPCAIAIALVLLGRAVAVYPLAALFRWSSRAISLKYQHVLWWGGLRGAIALALALALPDNLPERWEITILAFAVVAFSIFVQGLTMGPLVRRLGLVRP
jgi:Na+:H+ antiporter